MIASGDISEFVGRLHIVLLHLPIGFLMLLGTLELLSMVPQWRHANLSNRFVLWLTAPVTVLTAVCGWLLAESGSYDARLLLFHRWTGIAVAVAACLLLWVHTRGWISVYRCLVFVTMGLTIYAGHLGGSLTHGRDFLTRPFSSLLQEKENSFIGTKGSADKDESAGYGHVPSVLDEYCISCHGPDKSKGGLRLDSMDHILAGGDTGPVLKAGDADRSLLLERMLLPLDDDEHMPPEGKPQPDSDDIDFMRSWIHSLEQS